MKVRAAIRKFSYGNLNQYVYGRAHDAIIGEWVRWWISCSNRQGTTHAVINPAIQASFRKKTYCADLLLAEHRVQIDKQVDPDDGEVRDFFRIVGVAEIENDNSIEKLRHRVNSIEAYEKCRDKKYRRKFPDLNFAVLCTYYPAQDISAGSKEIENTINYLKEKSKASKLLWIFYVLKKKEFDEKDEFFFKVNGYARDRSRMSFLL